MKTRRPARPGFSLLELVLVLVILGVLASVAAYNLIGQGEKAKRKATLVSMETISSAITQYQLEQNVLPPTIATLGKEHLDPKKLKDGWSRDFYYAVPGAAGRPFDLISAGKDGELGTTDDIDFATSKPEG